MVAVAAPCARTQHEIAGIRPKAARRIDIRRNALAVEEQPQTILTESDRQRILATTLDRHVRGLQPPVAAAILQQHVELAVADEGGNIAIRVRGAVLREHHVRAAVIGMVGDEIERDRSFRDAGGGELAEVRRALGTVIGDKARLAEHEIRLQRGSIDRRMVRME